MSLSERVSGRSWPGAARHSPAPIVLSPAAAQRTPVVRVADDFRHTDRRPKEPDRSSGSGDELPVEASWLNVSKRLAAVFRAAATEKADPTLSSP